MSFLRKHSPLLAAAILLAVLVCLAFPCCRYYIDPDATAYLTIARRYAFNHGLHAVNGYWSPLSCWLTALGMQAGLYDVKAAVLANLAGAGGFLLVSYVLFRRFGLKPLAQWLFCMAMAVFLAYAVYYQLFADLWECFLLLAGLCLLLQPGFVRSPLLWVAYGLIGAVAYFAKAYAFSFFLLYTLVGVWLLVQGNRRQWFKIVAVSVLVLLVGASPWLWLLHEHYGQWMTGTAGTLNMSWYLTGHASYRPEYGCLLPPAYPGSVYHWEDPYLVAGDTPHFWTSGHYFLLQCARLIQNFFKMAGSMTALSLFFFPLWLASLLVFLRRKIRSSFLPALQLLLLFFLLFPLPFLLINFEPRYLWSLLPPGMIAGYIALQQIKRRQMLAMAVFTLSFIAWPLIDFHTVWNTGRQEFMQAQSLKAQGIKGSFTADTKTNKDIQRVVRLAYFSGNSCYIGTGAGCSGAALLQEIRRYGIRYYFIYGKENTVFRDEQGKAFPVVYAAAGLRVVAIVPVAITRHTL